MTDPSVLPARGASPTYARPMPVRERDETGWDELPGGLSFTDEEDDELAATPAGRWLSTLLWLLVLSVLAGGAGVYGARWLGESDVRSVLGSSGATYGSVLDRLREAPDAAALADVAASAPAAAARLEADLERLEGTSGERRSSVARQVAAERDVLLAVGELDRLDTAPLRVWGDAHGQLTEAVAAESAARSRLLVVDPPAARRLPDSAAVLRDVGVTVGEAVVDDVAQAAADLLGELEAAIGTAQVRATAERADAQRAVVAAAGQGLGGGQGAAVLAAFSDALLAVAELRSLTPADTTVWVPVRGRLQSSLQVVADADADLAAGTVRGRLPLVLGALDRLVARAEAAQAEWQPRHDAAVAAQAADAAALRAHAERVRTAAAAWDAARPSVAALARAGAGPQELDAAWTAVDGVRLTLSGSPVPAAVAAEHAALVVAVEAVERPLRLAREQAVTEPVSVTALLAGWDGALARWEVALAAADAEVAVRTLPPPPEA